MAIMVKEQNQRATNKEFSQDYIMIRENAEKWPTRRKKYYNDSFATSKHAKKLKIDSEENK